MAWGGVRVGVGEMGNRARAGTSGRKKGQGWWKTVVGNEKKTKKKNQKGKAIGSKEPEHGNEKSKKRVRRREKTVSRGKERRSSRGQTWEWKGCGRR